MLFISNLEKAAEKDRIIWHIVPTLVVFLAFMGVTVWSWQTTKQQVASQKDQAINQEIATVESKIKDRMNNYQQILESANGLFKSSNDVDRDEWRTFYENYDIPTRLPGLQGIGYAELVPRDQLEAHQSRIRAEGFTDYTVTPVGDRPHYVPIIYPVSPLTLENYKSLTGFGFDIASDPARNQALEAANKSNMVALTGKITTMSGSPSVPQPAFIMYQPLHHKNDSHIIAGYAYAPFTATSFFEGIFGQGAKNTPLGFRIYDEQASSDRLLYQNAHYAEADGPTIRDSIKLPGRKWVIEYKASDSIVNRANRRNPTATLIAGIIFSALIAGLVLSLLIARTRTIAYAENQELQQAKDDLLSIASHQLRTPATGVKQYIGMLREGYAGKVTAGQKRLLNEAYASNERQLGIIDEILHVARIDTGRLILQKERIKIRDIIDQILREQSKSIKDKSQKILTSFPKKILYARGDPQYIRMAIENVISNAIKYTPDKGTITIKIKSTGENLAVIVADTGVGIDKNDMGLLFQKFSRIPNELSRQTAGSGVGLYIARQLIEMHDGRIEVTSQPGKGTVFTILLPLAAKQGSVKKKQEKR